MECRKCHGLMIEEWMADELDEAFAWRCVNCGSMMDQMIQRHHEKATALSVASGTQP